MLRNYSVQSLQWADKTLSELRAQQLEACEQRLAASPACGLFDAATHQDGSALWQFSHDGQELPNPPVFPTIEQLRQRVLEDLPTETAFLSLQEFMLAERLVVENGIIELTGWEEYEAAESLLRRLWCTVSYYPEHMLLRLQPPLLAPLHHALNTKLIQKVRKVCQQIDGSTRAVLYMSGFVHASQPLHALHHGLAKLFPSPIRVYTMMQRFLRTSFDYAHTCRGDMLLLHPGLAHPESILNNPPEDIVMPMDITGVELFHAFEGILPEEIPGHVAMVMQLHGYTRPGLSAHDAAEDLRILAKQGVSFTELKEVLASLLTVIPSPAMEDVLRSMMNTTMRWRGVPAAQIH